MDKKKQTKMQWDTLRQVLTYIGRYRWMLWCSVLLAAATVALTLYVPILLGRAIDRMVGAGQVELAAILPEATGAEVVQVVGRKVTLYRKNPEKTIIELR